MVHNGSARIVSTQAPAREGRDGKRGEGEPGQMQETDDDADQPLEPTREVNDWAGLLTK